METNKALAVIEKERTAGALVYAPQNLECPPLYKVEASVIYVAPSDFHDKEVNGKLLPRKEVVDKIGDAAGISFLKMDNELQITRMEAEPALDLPARSVFVAQAQGKVRLSDGSWRTSSVESFAFDYVARAYAEEPSDAVKRKKKLQEYYKAGPMRAATGARLRVIRQLTGLPNGFDPAELKACEGKLVFSRIVQNTDYILSTKEGKMMAIAMATGAAQQLYGPSSGSEPSAAPVEAAMRPVGPEHDEEPAPTGPQAGTAFDFDAPSSDPADQLRASLVEWANASGMPETVSAAINAVLDRDERRPEILEPMLGLVKLVGDKRLGQKGIGTVERVLLDANMTADTLKAYLAKASEAASVAGAA